MNTKDLQLNLWSLLSSLAKTLDLMSPEVADHCMRVAYLSLRLGEELGLSRAELRDLCIAGALHDIGAFSLHERLDLLAFEEKRATQHALAGHLLLKDVPLFSRAAKMVRFHHLPWRKGAGAKENGVPVPRGSHIVHLADRVAVRISRGPAILGQVAGICKSVTKRKGDRFVPRHVEAFLRIAAKDYVWLDIASDTMETSLERSLGHQTIGLDPDMLLSLSRMICRIIDFKSEFTATHSSGVAATGEALARLAGFSPRKRRMFEIAAYLHDLGKLAIPSEILGLDDLGTPQVFKEIADTPRGLVLVTGPGAEARNSIGIVLVAGMLVGMKAPGAQIIASVTFIAILMTILIQASTTKWLAEKLDMLEEE